MEAIATKGKDAEWSGLLKVPDTEIIKTLRIEVGKHLSYIHELEDRLKKREKKEAKKSLPKDLSKHIEQLEIRISKLNIEVDYYKQEYIDLSKRFEILKKEVLWKEVK